MYFKHVIFHVEYLSVHCMDTRVLSVSAISMHVYSAAITYNPSDFKNPCRIVIGGMQYLLAQWDFHPGMQGTSSDIT